jgi:hypothetical protein
MRAAHSACSWQAVWEVPALVLTHRGRGARCSRHAFGTADLASFSYACLTAFARQLFVIHQPLDVVGPLP